ncbi:uncharacterized protein METZ01_LOCUS264682 [marine metagenome]|uniref:Uncharacterized protein n=1 Tax=marine metagenome TaxID=408172 RepID=A0A382JJB3_9ZZZZ
MPLWKTINKAPFSVYEECLLPGSKVTKSPFLKTVLSASISSPSITKNSS